MKRAYRSGFTLVELVVVIMILGILASVAVPRFLDIANDASQGALQQSLSVVRNSIELYAARNGGQWPGDADDLEADLATYLRGNFPVSPVGVQNASIQYVTGAAPLTGASSEGTGWKYNKDTGQFICNHEDYDDM